MSFLSPERLNALYQNQQENARKKSPLLQKKPKFLINAL